MFNPSNEDLLLEVGWSGDKGLKVAKKTENNSFKH